MLRTHLIIILATFAMHVGTAQHVAAQPQQTRKGFVVDGQQGRLVIVRVLPGSAAARAGLRVGDVIVGLHAYGNFIVSTWDSSVEEVRASELGTGDLGIYVVRAGAFTPTLIEMAGGPVPVTAGPEPRPWTVGPPGRHFIGFGLGIDDAKLATCHTQNDCVVIERVFERSSAAAKKIVAGDRIIKVGALRPAVEIERLGAAKGIAFVLNEVRGSGTRLGDTMHATLFRPGTGEFEIELTAGIVTDPKVPAPPVCMVNADRLERDMGLACSESDDTCDASITQAGAQLASITKCIADAPTEHRAELGVLLDRARKVHTARVTEHKKLTQLALRDTACGRFSPLQSVVGGREYIFTDSVLDQGRVLACLRPRMLNEPRWGASAAMTFLASAEHSGGNAVQVALAFNLYARMVASRPEQPYAKAMAHLIAGYSRVVSVDVMMAALTRTFDAEIAARLAAGVTAALEAARIHDPNAAMWAEWDRYNDALAAVRPLATEIRAELKTGNPELMLTRLDAARAELLVGAKSRTKAIETPAFRELSGLARTIAATHGIPRPFEQQLPEAMFPTIQAMLYLKSTQATTRDADEMVHGALERGVVAGRATARKKEFLQDGPGRDTFTLRIKKVRTAGATTTIELDNKKVVTYAGQCRTALVFIDSAGQGWGKKKCSKSETVTQEDGPTSVSVPSAQLSGAKPGRDLSFSVLEDGSAAYPLDVWEGEKPRAIGPFEL